MHRSGRTGERQVLAHDRQADAGTLDPAPDPSGRRRDVGDGPTVAEAIDEGEQWLADRLDRLLAEPFDRQRRGPLELLQEAMRFPTAALIDLGFDRVERDPMAERAIPGDLFDLAPASSSTLGETVWHAHIAWGAAKANAMRQA